MIYTLHPRHSVVENVDKMIHCGDPAFGGAMYGCPHCGNMKFVPFRCHSRFCPTCGNKYSMERATSMSFKLIPVQHRHCVFTIDEDLRHFFLDYPDLLHCLFHSVTSVICRMFHKLNKSQNFTPGFIMVLHTFGRDLKWNPHIHCLISEGGYSDDGFWCNVSHFDYTFLLCNFSAGMSWKISMEIPARLWIRSSGWPSMAGSFSGDFAGIWSAIGISTNASVSGICSRQASLTLRRRQ